MNPELKKVISAYNRAKVKLKVLQEKIEAECSHKEYVQFGKENRLNYRVCTECGIMEEAYGDNNWGIIKTAMKFIPLVSESEGRKTFSLFHKSECWAWCYKGKHRIEPYKLMVGGDEYNYAQRHHSCEKHRDKERW